MATKGETRGGGVVNQKLVVTHTHTHTLTTTPKTDTLQRHPPPHAI